MRFNNKREAMATAFNGFASTMLPGVEYISAEESTDLSGFDRALPSFACQQSGVEEAR